MACVYVQLNFLESFFAMFQESEIITLLIGLMGLLIVVRFFKEGDIPGMNFLKAGCVMMVCAYVFTLVEGMFFESFFNVLEHFGYAASGLLFAAGFWKISKMFPNAGIDEGQKK